MTKIRLKPRRFMPNGVVEYDTDFAGGGAGSLVPFDLMKVVNWQINYVDPAEGSNGFEVKFVGPNSQDYFDVADDHSSFTIKKTGLYAVTLSGSFGATRPRTATVSMTNEFIPFHVLCTDGDALFCNPQLMVYPAGTIFGGSTPNVSTNNMVYGESIPFMALPIMV